MKADTTTTGPNILYTNTVLGSWAKYTSLFIQTINGKKQQVLYSKLFSIEEYVEWKVKF